MNDAKLMIENIDVKKNGQFVGYASVFGNVNGYGTIVDKGAFANVLKTARPAITFSHKTPVGHIVSIKEDGKGLLVEGQLWLDTEAGKGVYNLIKKSDYKMSCWCESSSYFDAQGVKHYDHVTKLCDVSITNNPANPDAEIVFVHDANGPEKPKEATPDAIRDAENRGFQAGFNCGFSHGKKEVETKVSEKTRQNFSNAIDRVLNKIKG